MGSRADPSADPGAPAPETDDHEPPAPQTDDDQPFSLPGAHSFWDEDSSAVQSAMPTPSGDWRDRSEPPAPRASRRHRLRAPRLRLPAPAWAAHVRPGVAIGVIAASLVAVLAVIGLVEGGNGAATDQAASLSKISTHSAAGGANAAPTTTHTHEVTRANPHRRSHDTVSTRHRVRARRRTHHIVVTTLHRHRARAASHTVRRAGAPTHVTPTHTGPTTSPASSAPAPAPSPTDTDDFDAATVIRILHRVRQFKRFQHSQPSAGQAAGVRRHGAAWPRS